MYEDVLFPTDGSSGTLAALDHALAIARDSDAAVHGLYVLDRRLATAAQADTKDEVIQSLEEEAERALHDVEVHAAESAIDPCTEQREGIPHREILEYADEHGIDLLVMGTHGRTGPDRIANLGSTTERVVKNGEVPVLVVDIE